MSKELADIKDFLRGYLAWVDAGAVEDYLQYPYRTLEGLCGNAVNYSYAEHPLREAHDRALGIHEHMNARFSALGLEETFPFGGLRKFVIEREEQSFHLNPDRIRFCRDWLAELDG